MNYIQDVDKLYGYMDRIWDIACKHGFHDEAHSAEHYLGLIISEVGEAIDADRNGVRAKSDEFEKKMSVVKVTNSYGIWFNMYYGGYIKGSVEEEFADIVIRILDMAYEVHGKRMYPWKGYDDYGQDFKSDRSFVESAWFFVKETLNSGTMNISDSISYMYAWSEYLGIDLDKHIEWKIKYNELRPYKHGGKKY